LNKRSHHMIKPCNSNNRFRLGETDKAEELQRLGTDLLRRLLSEPKRSNYSKKQLALKFVSFQQLTVDQAVQSQQLVKALELAEKGKNACLTWLLHGYSEEISSPSYQEIQQLLNPTTAIIYWHLSPAALTTFIIKHGAEEPIVIKEPLPSPPVKKRLRPLPSPLLGENERGGEGVREERETISSPPLLEDTISSLSSPPFLRGAGGDLPPHDKPNLSFQHLHDFETWVNNWNKQYQEYRSKEKNLPPQPPLVRGEQELDKSWRDNLKRGEQEYNLKRGEQELDKSWRDNLPEMLEHLGNILNIPAILSELTNINQLILIPHRDLHRFPLHALFPDNFTITYLPSAQIGLTLKAAPPSPNPFPHQGGRGVREESIDKEATEETADTNTSVLPPSPSMGEGLGVRVTNARDNLLSVEHPNSEGYDQLPYAELESAAITQLFNNPQRLAGKDATKTAVEAVLPTGYSIFHFTGHGTYNFNCPSQSALILSGKDKLTLEDILRLPLNPYQLVSLSSCETALTGNQTITTEYVGLVSAFLYQQVSHVVSTLWTVESAASALFMIKFYRLRSKGKPEAVALRKTQQWLRQLSAANLARLYRYVIHHPSLASEHNIRPFLKTELRKLNKMAPTDKPYKHPYHWAAFTLTGFYKSDA
jgi:CHAT domain-containing protein